MPERNKTSISIFRKVLLWAFVIGTWVIFYWYQDYRYSNKKPTSTPTHPAQTEPPNPKKQPPGSQ